MRVRLVRCDSGRPVLLWVLGFLIATTLYTGSFAGRRDGCEPAAELDVSARVLQRIPQGATERVTVEIAVRSPHDRPFVQVGATLFDRSDPEAPVQLPARAMALDAGGTTRYTIELASGHEHHLLLAVRSEGDDGTILESSADVRINLDPEREPEVLDRVLQYRARMGSPAEPAGR